MQIDTGAVVDDKYELVRLLGRGSMGEVWVAHHKTLGEKLALKLLTQVPSGSDEIEDARQAAARFKFEAQVAARLSRKTRHIVRVTDHGEEDGLAYLVMELLDGRTLETALTHTPTLPLGSVVKLVTQIARALTQAHADGVLHRDLKPANVFLTTDEEGALLAKLLDFGIARAIHAHRVPKSFATHKGVVFGTPAYMSPEQARASTKLDHRCDLWALATIAYETLTGDLPVAGNDAEELLKNLCAGRIIPIRSRNPRLPAALGKFFDRAFAERLDVRYASAADLAQDFEQASGSSPFGTAAMSLPEPPSRAAGGRRAREKKDEARRREAEADAGLVGDGGADAIAAERPRTQESGAWTSTSDPQRRKTRLAVAAAGAAALGVVAAGAAWRVVVSPRAVPETPESAAASYAPPLRPALPATASALAVPSDRPPPASAPPAAIAPAASPAVSLAPAPPPHRPWRASPRVDPPPPATTAAPAVTAVKPPPAPTSEPDKSSVL